MSPSRILNQVGLSFQFVALWLVTPDIIGEERMLKAGEKLAKAAERFRKPIFEAWKNCQFLGCLFVVVFVLGSGSSAYAVFEFNWNVLTVLKIAGVIAAVIVGVPFAMLILSAPIYALSWLAKKTTKSSKSLLAAGAYCFTIGFGLLFAATFFGP
jgi:hypothetical protein